MKCEKREVLLQFLNDTPQAPLDRAKVTCDKVLEQHKALRHLGYYNSFGKILYDKSRGNLEPLKGEGLEEMHILNGTAATSLVLWKRSDYLLGRLDAVIMVMEKIVDLLVPHGETGSYFLAVFDKNVPMAEVDKVRLSILEYGKI
jgi:hypothetical protein